MSGPRVPEDPAANPRTLAVPVSPVGTGARSMRGPLLVVSATIAVVGVAIAAGVLDPVVAPPSPVPPTSVAAATGTPPATPPDLSAAIEVGAAQLRVGLADGTLDEALVVADGVLDVMPLPCASMAGAACTHLALRGLEGVPIRLDRQLTAATWDEIPVRGALMFRAGPGSLTYLGRAPGRMGSPVTVADLLAGGDARSPFSLAAVSGWLVFAGIHPCSRAIDATPCPAPPPWLTDQEPLANGIPLSDAGTIVIVDESAVPPVDQVVTRGPFLARELPGTAGLLPAWHIVASFDPRTVLRLAAP